MSAMFEYLKRELAQRYEVSSGTDKMLAIHLFGIEFAEELGSVSINDHSVAALGRQLGPQFRAKRKLAHCVTPKER